jgi:TM2 domain-containing membrane protein YozV
MAGSPPQGYPPHQGGPQPQGQYPQGQYPQGQYPQQHGASANAPYGVDPKTGLPYSDKQKMLAGILQLLPVVILFGGIGRLYAGHTGIGVAQLILSCTGIGSIWSIIDGILILVSDDAKDANGLPLRPN